MGGGRFLPRCRTRWNGSTCCCSPSPPHGGAPGRHPLHGLRYLDPTLAAYVGEESPALRPRDLAEIRVFHGKPFLCRAVCQELAGQTIPLKEIIAARNARRRALRQGLRDRASVVNQLLAVHQPDYDHPVYGPGTAPIPTKASNRAPLARPVSSSTERTDRRMS